MAFPSPSSITPTQITSSLTSHVVNLPASIVSGKLLLAWAEVRNAGTWTLPSGWNQLDIQAGGGSVGALTVFWKIASGSEGSTATWTASVGTTAAWQTMQVSDWYGSGAPAYAKTSGDVSAADPPSLSPAWGADDTLWITIAGHTAASNSAWSAGPSGFSGFTNTGASSGGAACSVASAYLQSNTATENPGAYTVSGSNRWWASFTLGIRPAAASLPVLDTAAADDITKNSATLNGEITDVGVGSCTARGFVYGTSSESDPGNVAPGSSAYDAYTSESGTFSTGVFDAGVSGLTPETTYYVRAWAQNSAGYAYGDEISFATLAIMYAISGVVSLNGAPVESATVRCIRQSDDVALTAQETDGSGVYTFDELEGDELYHLAVEYADGGTLYNAKSLWDVEPYEVE